MSALRLPRKLFGGRMRTSTALLAVAFVGVLLLWYAVRPDPETVTEEVVRVTRTVEKQKPAKERAAEQEGERPRATVTPTRTPTPRPTPAAPTSKTSPGVPPTLLDPSASPEPTGPTATPSSKGKGLFEFQRRGTPTPTTDSPTPAEPGG